MCPLIRFSPVGGVKSTSVAIHNVLDVSLPTHEETNLAGSRTEYPSDEERHQFGFTLTCWCNRNGWVHSTLSEWGFASGFPSVRDSTFNRLQNGKINQPAPLTFIQLGLANQRVAAQDFSGVTDRQLKDRLVDSEPICHEDGTPWDGMHFFGHFIGIIQPPSWAKPVQLLSAERCLEIGDEQRAKFKEICDRLGIRQGEGWKSFEGYCTVLTKGQRDKLHHILCGWDDWTPEEISGLCLIEDRCPVEMALEEWADAN